MFLEFTRKSRDVGMLRQQYVAQKKSWVEGKSKERGVRKLRTGIKNVRTPEKM